VNHPTIQLLLDFSKHSVWPFHDFRDHERLQRLVVKLKLDVNEPLERYQLENIFREYHQDVRPNQVTDENLEKFVTLVFEIRQQFGDMLTKEALKDLHRMGHAPKRPRNIISY
jgi:hypothetical protein